MYITEKLFDQSYLKIKPPRENHQIENWSFSLKKLQTAWHQILFFFSVDTDPEHLDTVSAIAEASQTTYVRGRWVYTDTSHETQYRIVHPMLPGSGDYSAYNLLCMF